jgi:hypothetical protein
MEIIYNDLMQDYTFYLEPAILVEPSFLTRRQVNFRIDKAIK